MSSKRVDRRIPIKVIKGVIVMARKPELVRYIRELQFAFRKPGAKVPRLIGRGKHWSQMEADAVLAEMTFFDHLSRQVLPHWHAQEWDQDEGGRGEK